MLGSGVRQCSRYATTRRRIWKRDAAYIAAFAAVYVVFLCSAFPAEPSPPQDSPKVSITPRSAAPRRAAAPRSNLRVDVRMILVPVAVTDPWQRPVMNLP